MQTPTDLDAQADAPASGTDAARAAASTRDRLVAAAARVFEAEGYDGARVSHIAREAGLTTGAIYANFDGKHDLLMQAIGSRSRNELDDLLTAFLTTRFDALLRALGRRLVRPEGHERESLLLDALAAARRDDEMKTDLHKGFTKREELFRSLVDEGVAQGALAPDTPVHAFTRLCMLLALGSATVRSIDLDVPDADEWSVLIDRLVDAFTNPTDPVDPAEGGSE